MMMIPLQGKAASWLFVHCVQLRASQVGTYLVICQDVSVLICLDIT